MAAEGRGNDKETSLLSTIAVPDSSQWVWKRNVEQKGGEFYKLALSDIRACMRDLV
jgi:hypothetical protein